MKITRLRLHNLASIAQEHIIDFESAPLANAGLIAITGKTGAGKSTLLDAMCLALFDQIPRLHGALGTLTDASGQSITLKDSKHILRRGCTFGFAEVDFIALDQKRYRAYWEVRRARQKVDGKLKHDRSVTCLYDGRVLTQKISECTPCVQQLIGLTFEQFTRAVLLAQSEVGAFLKAKDQERANLLEYLTNSDIFSLVSQRSFEKTKNIRYQLEKIQDLAGHVKLLSHEEKHQLSIEKKQLETAIQTSTQKIKSLEHAEQWFQVEAHFQQQLEDQITKHTELISLKKDIDEKKQTLLHLEQFSEIRHRFEAITQVEKQQHHVQQKISTLEQQFIHIQQQFKIQQHECNRAEQHAKQCEQEFTTLQPIFQHAFSLHAQREQLLAQYKEKHDELIKHSEHLLIKKNDVVQQQEQIKHLHAQQNEIHQQLKPYQPYLKLALEPNANLEKLRRLSQVWQELVESEHTDFEHFKQQQAKQIKQLDVFTQKFHSIEQLEARCQIQQNRISAQQQQTQHADFIIRFFNQLIDQHNQQEKNAQQLTNLLNSIQTQQVTLKHSEKDYQSIEQEVIQLQNMFQQQSLIKSDYVETLRATLQPNESCFVCGSTEHPFLKNHQLLEDAFSAIQQQQLDQLLEKKRVIFETWQHNQTTYTTLKTQHKALALQQDELNIQIENQLQHIKHEIKDQIPSDQPLHTLYQQFLTYQSTLKQQLELDKHNYENYKNHLIQFKQQSMNCIKYEHIQTNIQETQHLEQQLQAYIDCADVKEQWLQQKASGIQHCLDAIPYIVKQQKYLDQNQEKIESIFQYLQPKNQEIYSLEQYIQQLSTEIEHIKQQGLDIAQAIKTLMLKHTDQTYSSVEAWFQAMHENKKEAVLNSQRENEKQHLIQQEYDQHKRMQDDLQQQDILLKQHLEEHQNAKKNWFAQYTHFNDDMIQSCLSFDRNQIQELQKNINHFNEQSMLIQENIRRLKEDLNTHQKQLPKYKASDILAQKQEHQKQLEYTVEQKEIIQSKLLSDQTAQQQQQAYIQDIEKLQEEVHRWHKISELIGSKEGTKFQKIAQEHHLDILVEYANQQLQPLSQRYQLQRITNSLGLAIIDHDMNSEIRPVLSLSGGETFLVSLALALAIANMASGAMKLESLFIDEGFGTLDPTSLHIVMDALDRLQSQGRKVILISHVQEMHERIPTQIRVEPVTVGTSQINIVG